MFYSNQIFSLSGDKRDEDALRKAVELLVYGYDFSPRAVRHGDDGCLYLYEHKPSYLTNGELEELEQNVEYITQLIKLHFLSANYQKAIQKVVCNSGGDGSIHEGWTMELTHENLTKVIKIAPFWCFAHK